MNVFTSHAVTRVNFFAINCSMKELRGPALVWAITLCSASCYLLFGYDQVCVTQIPRCLKCTARTDWSATPGRPWWSRCSTDFLESTRPPWRDLCRCHRCPLRCRLPFRLSRRGRLGLQARPSQSHLLGLRYHDRRRRNSGLDARCRSTHCRSPDLGDRQWNEHIHDSGVCIRDGAEQSKGKYGCRAVEHRDLWHRLGVLVGLWHYPKFDGRGGLAVSDRVSDRVCGCHAGDDHVPTRVATVALCTWIQDRIGVGVGEIDGLQGAG